MRPARRSLFHPLVYPVLALLAVSFIPADTKQGVDESLHIQRIPLAVKAVRFYGRHLELNQMLAEATADETDPERRLLRLLAWTQRMVRPQPPDRPVLDDHISHIVHRQYGTDGQRAEVFTALAYYDGHEARWAHYTPPGATQRIVLSFVKSGPDWWVFDVTNGGWFETPAGHIAAIQDFHHPASLRPRGAASAMLDGLPYLAYFQDLDRVHARSFSRAPGQTPWHRFLIEAGLINSSDR
jgi:hypothetical protein